ncbi:hypothetical protein L1987_46165 [Smallanthus sonchifolius]|uniref:Uncharacterized protein n=1 Tax=Smallanthus sonchifolius TaxID=185202 RepID=A0ACB9FZZ3_9ASTR|nr:hypothetical protein L1987_46165 [Smallanthus sonchifolius]
MYSSSRTHNIGRFCQTCKIYSAYHDSRHCKIKQEFRTPPTVLNVLKSEPEDLSPNPIFYPFLAKTEYIPEPLISNNPKMEELPYGTNEDPAFWSKVSSFCDSISAVQFTDSSLHRSITPPATLRTPSCLFDDNMSFGVESPNTLMVLANHNPWADELSQDSDYTPFDDEFSQDEINGMLNNK